MSTEQHSQAEKCPPVLKMDIRMLGVGHFQDRDEMVRISRYKKALYIVPDKRTRPVASGVWVRANQFEFYQMDFGHGLLYIGLSGNVSVELANNLVKLVEVADLMDSRTRLRGSALRMWQAEDVDLGRVVEAFESIGVPRKDLENLAKDMFPGVKVSARQGNAVPLSHGIKRSHSPGNPLSIPHDNLFLQRVNALYESGTTSDCKLISRVGKEFMAHRTILAAWSPVLANMFATNMTEKASGVCRLGNFDGNVVDALLSFLYTGVLPDIDRSVKNSPRYLYLADLRELGSLRATAAKFIGEHVSDF